MTELLMKLNKRRSLIEAGKTWKAGANEKEITSGTFENSPLPEFSSSLQQESPDSRPGTRPSTPSGLRGATLPKTSAGEAAAFMLAISRRRATVDDCAETFESKPSAKVADCGHEADISSSSSTAAAPSWSAELSSRKAGRLARGGQADAADSTAAGAAEELPSPTASGPVAQKPPAEAAPELAQQAAAAQATPEPAEPAAAEAAPEPAQEAAPAEAASELAEEAAPAPADEAAPAEVATAPAQEAAPVLAQEVAPAMAEAASEPVEEAALAPAEAVELALEVAEDAALAEVELDLVEDGAAAGRAKGQAVEATAALPTPSRASSSSCAATPREAQEAVASIEEEAAEEAGAQAEDGEEADLSRGSAVKVQGNRITWLVGLGSSSLPAVFESPPFAVGGYEPVTFRLRTLGGEAGGCLLALTGPPRRPAGIKVGLFAGKGWAKRTLVSWPDGHDLEERFDVNVSGRSSILCGLVFQAGNAASGHRH